MKIAIINSFYEFGSTGSMAQMLLRHFEARGHSVRAYYGRGKRNEEAIRIGTSLDVYHHAALARVTGWQGGYSKRPTNRLIKDLEVFEPDIILILNLHGYYLNERMLFGFIANKGIPIVYIMCDEYPFLGKCCFSGDCTAYMNGCGGCKQIGGYPKSIFLDRSADLFKQKAKEYGGCSKIVFMAPEYSLSKARMSPLTRGFELEPIDWGVDMKEAHPFIKKQEARLQLGIETNRKVYLTIGPKDNPLKGIGRFFYPAAQICESDALFIHVGADVDHVDCNDNLMRVPYLSDQVILGIYCSAADCVVIPSLQDTMPLAAIISLASGTPVCCFRTSGFQNMFADGCVYWIQAQSPRGLEETLDIIPEKDEVIETMCREYAEKRYSSTVFCKRVETVSCNLVKEARVCGKRIGMKS